MTDPQELDEAAWLGEDNEIVRRSRARERAAAGGTLIKEHRVVGPPGCGKTTWLSRQATKAAGMYGHDGVLLSSLTRTAAQEIAGRDTPIPRHMIGTLHAHCYRALDRPALAETPEGIHAWNDYCNAHGLQAIWRMDPPGGGDLDHAPTEIDRGRSEGEQLRNQLANLRARCTLPELWGERTGGFAHHWQAFKDDTNRLDFTDLIEQCISRHISPPGAPAVFMLDEAQDMSRLEMNLARQWATEIEQLVIVADPAQALYQWRGSDPDALFEGPAESEIVLEQSYRVPAAVHRYAVDWIGRMPGYRHFAYRPTPEPGRVTRTTTRHAWMSPEGLVDDIQADLDQDRTVMVLATCGYMLRPLCATLKQAGIPYHNPYRPNHGGWNPLRGAGRLLAFLHPDADTWGEEAAMWTYGDLRRFVEPLKAQGLLAKGVKSWLESKSLVDRFGETAEEQTVDVTQIPGLFRSEEDAMAATDLDVNWWQSNHLERTAAASQFPCRIYETRGGKALRERPRLTVGTIHSVKGGESDVVYLWPDISQAAYTLEWNNPQRRAPLYRTFYVGMTRARHDLHILAPSGSTYVPLPAPEGQP